jgi:TP901 family phage tail tape measure protein
MQLGGFGGGGGKVGTGYVKIRPDAEGFGRELDSEVGREAETSSGLIGGRAGKAFRGAFLAGTAAMAKGVFDFASFDQGMREVFTLLPGISGPVMAEMTSQVKDFAGEFGVLPNEVIPALYDSLSAGVDRDNVFTFLEDAQRLAKAGATDLATSVDGLTTVLNAYGMEATEAERVSDVLFTAMQAGKTTIGEMSSAMFQVAPIASSFGVSIEDVAAATATLTAQGTPTSVVMTQLKGAISELGKEGTKASKNFQEMSGQTFPEFIASGGSLVDAAELMKRGADELGLSVVDLFGSIEAGQAFVGLSNDLETAAANLDATRTSAGATAEGFEMMDQGLAATMEKLKARFAVVFLNLGETLAPFVGAVGGALATVLDLFTKIPAPAQGLVIIFATLTAGIIGFAGPILRAIEVFRMLGTTMSVLAANPVVLVLLGLAAVAFVIYKNWDTVKQLLGATWDAIQTAARALASSFTAMWRAVAATVAAVWEAITSTIANAVETIRAVIVAGFEAVRTVVETYLTVYRTIFETMWRAITVVVENVWQAITVVVETAVDTVRTVIETAWNAVVTVTETAWNTARTVVESIGGGIVGFVTGIPETIGSAFSTLAEIIAAPFRVAFQGIVTAWNSTVGGFGFTAPGWVPGLGGKGFTIPSMATGGIASEPMIAQIGDAGRDNPEIVSPVALMRETVAAAIVDAGGGGSTISLTMNVDAEVRDPRFFEEQATEILRVVQRELDRAATGAGRPSTRIAVA